MHIVCHLLYCINLFYIIYCTSSIYYYICHCTAHPRGTVGMDDKDQYSVVDWNHVSIVAYQLCYGSKLESL